jgi:putative endonuclease
MRDYGDWVYILASKRNGTLYTGVTNALVARVTSHREGKGSHFTRKYGVTRLVWFESHERIETAIQRESSVKRWCRRWKLDLIESANPQWRDLYEDLVAPPKLPDWLLGPNRK